ncbi:MAG: VOC family protein [Chloroflexi bacterium]|nr:VOC family protein [Chloroflexota bacterium]
MTNTVADEAQTTAKHEPQPARIHHIAIPVKDMSQTVRFFTTVLGAEFLWEREAFAEVKFADVIIGISPQKGGWTAPDAEFPHYAFAVEAEDLWPLKERLEAHGVPTHAIWTRNGYTGLMYFRDPSGNLYELYCARVRKEDEARMTWRGNDGFAPPIDKLSYDWKG